MKGFSKPRILILYAEVMEYLLAGINQYKKDYPNAEVLLFELDEVKLTKFSFNAENFIFKRKSDYCDYSKFREACLSFKPDIVLISGRMNRHYLKVAKELKNNNVYTVTLQDTIYVNTIRQNIIRMFSRILYRKYFKGFWGAGSPQVAFGYSLGFTSNNIFEGLFTANSNFFNPTVRAKIEGCNKKKVLYVGRFSEEKNLQKLIAAFTTINEELGNIHELLLVGDGPLRNELDGNENLKIYPFMTSDELIEVARSADIFCLPSKRDAWGVVIHEFALIGLPLILSNRCGANSKFLIEGFNGYSFDPFNTESIQKVLKKILMMDNLSLKRMGENSNYLGLKYSPEDWSNVLNSIYVRHLSLNGL